MSVLRVSEDNGRIVCPDNYPSIDTSNLLSTATSYTATQVCYAITKGAISINGVGASSSFNQGVCFFLNVGDTATAGSNMYVFGVKYSGGV